MVVSCRYIDANLIYHIIVCEHTAHPQTTQVSLDL